MPNYFLVTVTSTDGVIITAVQQPVAATIHVALPQNVDECLIVNISAGNSAGMSSPTEVFTVGMLIILHALYLCFYDIVL